MNDEDIVAVRTLLGSIDDAVRAWTWLRAQGIAADRIVVGGDSAGGGLALALWQLADAYGSGGGRRDHGEDLPAHDPRVPALECGAGRRPTRAR